MDHYERSSLNGFAGHFLDRAAGRRKDERWISDQLENPATSFVPVWDLKNLVTDEAAPHLVALSRVQMGDLLQAAESITLLGEEEGKAFFAVGLPSNGATSPDTLARVGRFEELRKVAGLLDRWEGGLLAYARAMTHWHRRHRFCGDCGSQTASSEGGHMRICTNKECGQLHFPRTDPAIIVLVTSGEHCLLGRQAIWPKGMYSTIAGFVEPGETLEDAVIREVEEEAAIRIRAVHYHSSQPWPFPGSIMLGFTAEAATEKIRLNDKELEDARWFCREEIQKALMAKRMRMPTPVSIAYRLIEDWFDAVQPGRLKSIQDRIQNKRRQNTE